MTHSTTIRYCLNSPILFFHHFWNARLSYVLSLMLLLQRTPVIRHLLELPRTLVPKFADILRATAPLTIGAATTHSVTGATGVVPVKPSVNPAQAKVGEPFAWVFRTTGEKAKSYSFDGLPPGVKDSGVVQNAVSSITGTPTAPGTYKVTIIGWEKSGQGGRKTPAYTLTVDIAGGLPPAIIGHPLGGIFDEGDQAILSVQAEGADLTFQWKKDGQPVAKPTGSGQELMLGGLSADDAGTYSVEVSNGSGLITSETAIVRVRRSGSFEYWKSKQGETDPLADPDQDGLSNLIEYALGTNPQSGGHEGAPSLRVERTADATRLVADFDLDPNAIDSVVQVERAIDLANNLWETVQDGVGGASVILEGSRLTVSVPTDIGAQFLRLNVSLK